MHLLWIESRTVCCEFSVGCFGLELYFLVNDNAYMEDLRFSQLRCWKFKSSRVLCHVCW